MNLLSFLSVTYCTSDMLCGDDPGWSQPRLPSPCTVSIARELSPGSIEVEVLPHGL